ncbi:MAG TPA: hypothetical protein VGJ19_01080 [Streptosporangiaceae bacterium]
MAAAAGGEDARALAERLTASLDSATRLVLLDALSAAAGEITRDMAPGSVDLRLRDQEPTFVVTLPPPTEAAATESPEPAAPEAPPASQTSQISQAPQAPDDADAAMVRINLRLPEHLKSRVEDAAGQAGLSVNSWLVRAATAALDNGTPGQGPGPGRRAAREARRAATSGQHFTGWVR